MGETKSDAIATIFYEEARTAFVGKRMRFGGIKAITEGIDTIFTSKEEKQQLINELE